MAMSVAIPEGTHLSRELETYKAHQAELLEGAANQYVLIKADQIIGLYEQEADAFSEGYRRFRLEAFMVKQVLEQDKIYYVGGSSFVFLDFEPNCVPS